MALLVVLAGCASSRAAPSPRAIALVTHASRVSTRPLAELVVQPVPARDLTALANELTLHPPRAISPVARTSSPNYPVGHTDTFSILGEDTNRYFHTPATIRYETPHLYMYIQNGVKVDDAAMRKAADLFEKTTYPTDRAYFGSEWSPGVDGDVHITCLVADLRSSSAGGYFSSEDEYPRVVNPYSNQREMIYINSTNSLPGDHEFDRIMAHEFQHMIHWHMHAHDNAWLNEGMSMMAERLNGFAPSQEMTSFELQPETQLNSWAANNDPSHYGAAYLYLLYLYDHFGRGVIHDIVDTPTYTDFVLVNTVLRKHHIARSADALFRNWLVANWINMPSINRGAYAYRDLPRKVTVADAVSVPFSSSHALAPYSGHYVSLSNLNLAKPFTLHFNASPATRLVGVSGTAPFWWSNKGDMSDTRLQRSVDLSHVHRAALHFSTWYDTEKDYDYAYVEASTDAGKTWQTLPSKDTTKANPTGASYGNAFNGASKGWLAESVDLSRYVGKHIQLRFQYVTDDVYTGQGFLVRHISIPEIGLQGDFSGWHAHGFVPVIQNVMPLTWSVRVILSTVHGTRVKSMRLASGAGSMRVDPAALGLKGVVLVISSAAPKTTVQTAYRISATDG